MNDDKNLIIDVSEKKYAKDCLSSWVNELKDKYYLKFSFREEKINNKVKEAYFNFLDKVSVYDLDNPYDFSLDLYTEDIQDLVLESYIISQALDQNLVMEHGDILIDNDGNTITKDGNIIVKKENGKQRIKVLKSK